MDESSNSSNHLKEGLDVVVQQMQSKDANHLDSIQLLEQLSCDDESAEIMWRLEEENDDKEDDDSGQEKADVVLDEVIMPASWMGCAEEDDAAAAPAKQPHPSPTSLEEKFKTTTTGVSTANHAKNIDDSQQPKNNHSSSVSSMDDDLWNPKSNDNSNSNTVSNQDQQSSDGNNINHNKNNYSSSISTLAASYDQISWWSACLDAINQFRYHCGMFVNNGYVQFLIIVLIAINAAMMGMATFDFIKLDPKLSDAFETTDFVFLIIFTVELGLQLIYHGIRLLLDGWLVFDLIIIVTSWSFSSLQIIRAFRIFRALRLVTRIKIMQNLILAMFSVMPRMAAIGLMLCLIFYIFGVMFTQLFKDLYEEGYTEYDYFGGLDWTFLTLFQMMTLDDWADISREVIPAYKWAGIPFALFVVISGFIVVNLIIAVICDAIGALHADQKARLHGDYDETKTDAENAKYMDIREQLDELEDHVEELTRIQARTFHTLQYLTKQIQMQKLKQELHGKTTTSPATPAAAPTSDNDPPVVPANSLSQRPPLSRRTQRKQNY
ncbi:ion transport protein [Nitzschia inconspicua]|uniref:Ion transport protein n=1 Tax=Nitzschia inconspicua TaxID=303405 RepID=A0A9K3L7R7_9STRA|nr:ion transport protein [Nitzschia inconspicua]